MIQKYRTFFFKFKRTFFFDIYCYFFISSFSLIFPPTNLFFVAWIAPFGFFLLINKYKNSYKKIFWSGILAGIVFQLSAFYWITDLAVLFGGFPFGIAFFITLLSGALLNTKFPVFMILFAYLQKKFPNSKIFFVGLCALICDIFSLQIFPWFFGYFLVQSKVLAQTAELFSLYGLSFLLFCLSYTLFRVIKFPFILKKKRLFSIILLPATLFFSFYFIGSYLLYKWENTKIIKTKNILIVQPNPPLEFRDSRKLKQSMENLIQRTKKLTFQGLKNKKVDLVFLGESAIPFFSAHNSKSNKQNHIYWAKFENLIQKIAIHYKTNVVFNEIDSIVSKNKNLMYFNSNVLYNPAGERKESYQKIKLLIFGEYMPFEFLYKLVPQTGRFEKGSEFKTIEYFKIENNDIVKEGTLLSSVCYEIIFPEFLHKFKDLGKVDFITNLTNDKWYGKTLEPYQHLELSRIRSIETRKWMVRATNSGISAIIDHLGQVKKQTESMSEGYLYGEIQVIDSDLTFYARFGNLPIYIFILFSLLIQLILKKKNEKI